MSRWRPEALVLGLDAEALAGPSGAWAAPSSGWDAASLQAAFAAAGNARTLRVLVAPGLCRHFVLAAPAGLRSLAEWRQLAALRAQQLFGGDAWAVVADWRAGAAVPCAALPAALLAACRQAAEAAGRVLGVESAVMLALDRLRACVPASGCVGFATPQHAVLAALRDGRVDTLQATRRPDGDDVAALAAQLARQATRESLLNADGRVPEVALAWAGAGARPPGAFDAGGCLPERRAGDTEADWARRLGALA